MPNLVIVAVWGGGKDSTDPENVAWTIDGYMASAAASAMSPSSMPSSPVATVPSPTSVLTPS